jgi:thioredoxin-dependent peroxiredoxin
MIREGDTAPAFTAKNQDGEERSLSDFAGRWVVLWWYPRASTSQCTLEGQTFDSFHKDFADAGAVVLGISFDSTEANCTFAQDNSFHYDLLSDPDQVIGTAYGVGREETDRFFGLPLRRTFLIAPDGRIARVYDVTDVQTHPQQILADIKTGSAPA